MIDLSVNTVPNVLDEEEFLRAARDASLRALALPHGGMFDFQGTDEHRTVFAQWLDQRGLQLSAAGILPCHGAQNAIHLAFADVSFHTGSIASESATFSGAILAARQLGLPMLPVEYDDQGIRPDSLDRLFTDSDCRAVFLTPICQNPLATEADEARRREVLEVCIRHDALIVEDDVYANYRTRTDLTYKQLAPDRVYYLTSLSKCSTPLLRIGLIAPPPDRLESVAGRLRADAFGASPMSLELACALIRSGAIDKAGQQLKEIARQRCEAIRSALPEVNLPMPKGSPHVWLDAADASPDVLEERLLSCGVTPSPPGLSAIGDHPADGLRISLMGASDSDFLTALKIISTQLG